MDDLVVDRRQPHVENFHDAVFAQHQVRRFNISMDDATLMGELQSACCLQHAVNLSTVLCLGQTTANPLGTRALKTVRISSQSVFEDDKQADASMSVASQIIPPII